MHFPQLMSSHVPLDCDTFQPTIEALLPAGRSWLQLHFPPDGRNQIGGGRLHLNTATEGKETNYWDKACPSSTPNVSSRNRQVMMIERISNVDGIPAWFACCRVALTASTAALSSILVPPRVASAVLASASGKACQWNDSTTRDRRHDTWDREQRGNHQPSSSRRGYSRHHRRSPSSATLSNIMTTGAPGILPTLRSEYLDDIPPSGLL